MCSVVCQFYKDNISGKSEERKPKVGFITLLVPFVERWTIIMKEKKLPLCESPIKVYSNYVYVLSVLLNNRDALNCL